MSLQYDADSLLTQAGALTITRDPASGRISGTTLGAVTTSHTYDGYGALDTFTVRVSGSAQYAYTLVPDSAGRISARIETFAGLTHRTDYGYDTAGRLETVTIDGALARSYGYDTNGNRVQRTSGGVVEAGLADDQDRLLWFGGATFTYRPSGALESRTVAGQTTSYGYDAAGNLLGVALPDGRTIEYVVDGQNRRVGKKVNGTLVEGFLYEGQLRPAAWLDGAGNVLARFVYGTRVNVPEYMETAAGTFRIVTDHLGTPRLVVNTSTGAVVQRIDYDEWGQVLADTNPGFQPFGFAGGLYDRDTGLVRFGARDYSPSIGRWTSKDKSRFNGGSNFYGYAGTDPINFIDPRGKAKLPADPSGLGPDWTLDPNHKDPNGSLWRHPNGDTLEFNKGRPELPGWKGKDHWHPNGDHRKHLPPGADVPDPSPVCAVPEGNPSDDTVDDELLSDEVDMTQFQEDMNTLIITLPVIIDILEGVVVIVLAL